MVMAKQGILREFILILVLNCLDFAGQFCCYSEVRYSRSRYKSWFTINYQTNHTLSEFPTCSLGFWNIESYKSKVENYSNAVDVYLIFLCLSGMVFSSYLITFLWIILRFWFHDSEDNKKRLQKVSFKFGFILTFTLDIPCSSIAVVINSYRIGDEGLYCWDCAQDLKGCFKTEELKDRVYWSQIALLAMFIGLVMITLWKGITAFYRWSKTDDVNCWQLRGCVSLFAGVYYVIVILTPSLAIFKHRVLDSEGYTPVLSNTVNILYMVGVIGWLIFALVTCCFPMLKCARRINARNSSKTPKTLY